MNGDSYQLDLQGDGGVRIPANEFWPEEMSDIRRYFDSKSVHKPGRWFPFFRHLDEISDIPLEFQGVGVRIPIPFQKWTTKRRIAWASYQWLRPFENGVVGHGRLPGLVELAGLSHLESAKVTREIRGYCEQFAIRHPRLFRWVHCRIAELDMVTSDFSLTEPRWRALEVRLRRRLVLLAGLLWQHADRACIEAENLSSDSLNLAAQATARLLQPPYFRPREESPAPLTRLHASLMVPVRDLERMRRSLEIAYPSLTQGPFDTASRLWERHDATPDRYLMLVSETIRPRRHAGFWMPVTEMDTLPGASSAFLNGSSSLVAKQRLPRLPSESLDRDWSNYIRTKVHGSFFVSLPVFAGDDLSERRSVVGVVNVNVGTRHDRVWERALNEGWLQAAANAIAPFAEIAHYASLARMAADQLRQGGTRDALVLDTAVPEWNAFPGTATRLSLPTSAGRDEDAEALRT